MTIDFSKPVNTDLASGVLAQLRENISSVLTQTMGSGTNVPTGTFRLNPTSGVPEYWNGSTWAKLFFATAASGGSANAQTISVGAGITAYQDGQRFSFPIGFTNTGSTTLTVNSIGVVTIYDGKTGAALIGGELLSGLVADVVYYNTKFYLLNGRNGTATWSPTLVGFSANPTSTSYYYELDGQFVNLYVTQGGEGTSGGGSSTSFTITAPFTAATISNASWSAPLISAKNGGAFINTGIVVISSASATLNLYTDHSGAAWSGSLGKKANFTLRYQRA